MPYAKTGDGYPTEMHRLIEICSAGGVSEVECESEKQARGQRARWYQFLAALKRDANSPPAWVDKKQAIEKVRKAMSIEVTLDGKVVIFRGRDTSKNSQVYANMKVTYPEVKMAPQTDSEADSIARLMEKLKGDGDGK